MSVSPSRLSIIDKTKIVILNDNSKFLYKINLKLFSLFSCISQFYVLSLYCNN